jgi:hypothetical protein
MRATKKDFKLTSIKGAYKQALAFMGNRTTRKLAHNTYMHRSDFSSHILITLHNNVIVCLHPDGKVQLSTCGWNTPTTRERLNRLLTNRIRLYTKKHVLHIRYRGREKQFQDGMLVR